MSLHISDKAAKRIAKIRSEQSIPSDTPLRISVVSGGCSGLTYNLEFDSEKEPEDSDKQFEDHGIKIVVDMRSFLYLAGTELEYTDGLTGQGFHFKNPNATRSCSCGESFSL